MIAVKKKKLIIPNKQVIVDSLNISHLKLSHQNEIISILMDNVLARLNFALWDKLSSSDKKDLKKVLAGSGKKALPYLESKIENLPDLIENLTRQAVDDFKIKRMTISK